jgi:hypothetical protein
MKIYTGELMLSRLVKPLWIDKLIFMKIGKNPCVTVPPFYTCKQGTKNSDINKRRTQDTVKIPVTCRQFLYLFSKPRRRELHPHLPFPGW